MVDPPPASGATRSQALLPAPRRRPGASTRLPRLIQDRAATRRHRRPARGRSLWDGAAGGSFIEAFATWTARRPQLRGLGRLHRPSPRRSGETHSCAGHHACVARWRPAEERAYSGRGGHRRVQQSSPTEPPKRDTAPPRRCAPPPAAPLRTSPRRAAAHPPAAAPLRTCPPRRAPTFRSLGRCHP